MATETRIRPLQRRLANEADFHPVPFVAAILLVLCFSYYITIHDYILIVVISLACCLVDCES